MGNNNGRGEEVPFPADLDAPPPPQMTGSGQTWESPKNPWRQGHESSQSPQQAWESESNRPHHPDKRKGFDAQIEAWANESDREWARYQENKAEANRERQRLRAAARKFDLSRREENRLLHLEQDRERMEQDRKRKERALVEEREKAERLEDAHRMREADLEIVRRFERKHFGKVLRNEDIGPSGALVPKDAPPSGPPPPSQPHRSQPVWEGRASSSRKQSPGFEENPYFHSDPQPWNSESWWKQDEDLALRRRRDAIRQQNEEDDDLRRLRSNRRNQLG